MHKTLVYCRVSTEEQAEKGYSLDAQEKYCRKFAEKNDHKVAGVFRDEGKSGTSLDRPALKKLLTRAQDDKSIKAVMIQETDRLARNTRDHLTIKALLQKAGVKLISVAQPMLDDSPEGKMIDTIIASVNQFQSDINSRKTMKGMYEKFESGWYPGWAPLGYLNKTLEDNKRIVCPDPKRWHLVRRALKMYLTGNYSAIELSDLLYEKGLNSKTGKKVPNSIMTDTLRNPFYAGIMRWGGREKQGKHKPMITLEEHKRILDILNAHNLNACRRRKHTFLLRGFVFCKICGGRYTAEVHKKRKVSYYHCTLKSRKGTRERHTNKGQNIEARELEELVEDRFKNIQFSSKFIDAVLKKLRKIYREQSDERESRKRILLNQKLALENKRDVAEEKLLSRTIKDEDFQRIRARLDQNVAQVKDQIDELEQKRTSEIDTIRETLKLTDDVYHTYKTAPYELKRQFLGLFWERFLVQDRRIVEAVPNRLVRMLAEKQHVIISDDLCPIPELIILLNDWNYMISLKEKVREIKKLLAQKKKPTGYK